MSNEPESIPELASLIDLARTQLTDAEPRRDAARLAVVRRRLAGERPRRERNRLIYRFALSAFVASALTVALFVGWQQATSLEMEVLAGELSSEGEVRTSAETTKILFSDGTRVDVEPSARARVTTLNRRGANVQLDHGQISLDVAKRPGASWNVLAGEYLVHVTGTSFAVAFDQGRQTLGVSMFAGSVRVSGPLLGQGIDVRRGERLLVDVARGSVRVESREAANEAATAAFEEPESPPEPAVVAPSSDVTVDQDEPERTSRRTRPRATPRSRSWQSQVASGEFEAVLKAAEERGLSLVFQKASLDDLDALADAARYRRRTSVARDALLGIRRRFPQAPLAREAAFLLGRLLEGSNQSAASALEWYQRYLDEDGRGVYAAQALGRKMLIVHRQSGADRALPIAREYLERFPSGPHASSARKLVTGR